MKTLNSEDESFDMVWQSAAARNDSGWTAELAIPFKSLRFPNQREQTWSLLLYRVYPRTSRMIISWTPYDRNNPSDLAQAGILTGLEEIESGGSLELLRMRWAAGRQSHQHGQPFLRIPEQQDSGKGGGGIQYSPARTSRLMSC